METTTQQKSLYSIDNYQGSGKWCFAIVLNRACDNYEENQRLFSESLLVFEKTNRRDWFDEETRELIEQADTEVEPDPRLKPNTPVSRKLKDIRNYFSHFDHKENCLYFKEDEPIRIIMEKAYEKAKEKVVGRLKKETDIKLPDLFETSGIITTAGVVFLASFFVERRIFSRLMGYVSGFRKTEGEYKITGDIFSTYCLKDSYSIHTPDSKAVLFRDILGYLSRVPSEYYQHNKEQCDKENEPERKTNKFISFALKYLEEFVFEGIANYIVSVGRMEVTREETKEAGDEGKEYKPYPKKAKVKVIFDSTKRELAYYINHNTVILQIQKRGKRVHSCKIGVNELKYLVLLCLQGKARDAIAAIEGYINRARSRFTNPAATIGSDEDERFLRGLPEFILKQSGVEVENTDKEKTARMKYICEKWTKKKEESSETELHRKGRDILRYINWHCERPLGVDEYNQLLTLLVNKDFAGFEVQLNELKRTERISNDIYGGLKDFQNTNALHEKVCDLVLEELDSLERNAPDKLAEYIGLIRTQAEDSPSYEDKVKAFIKQPMIYKGFLRDSFFKKAGKTFAKLVEETLEQRQQPDVSLRKGGKDCYHVPALDRFHKDNSVLYETLARDRLCAMVSRTCYENINENLRKSGQEIIWKEEQGKEFLYLTIISNNCLNGSESKFTIRFDRKHYTKLYVMDDAEFLRGLSKHFFAHEKQPIDYHNLYSDGINRYTKMQGDGIAGILKLEEKIVKKKNIPMTRNYIGFKEIINKSGFSALERDTLSKVRNGLLHYHLRFEPDDYNKFVGIMTREGLGGEKKNWKRKKK